MKRPRILQMATAVFAALLLVVLAGCSFDLGSIDISSLSLDTILGQDQPSVDEAVAQRRSERSSTVDSADLSEDGVLTVGVLSTQGAPFLITTSSGELTGLDIDVAYALADELGLAVKLVEVSSVEDGIAAGCDIVMGVDESDADDDGAYAVVGTYAQSAVGVFCKSSSSMLDASDLTSMTFGVQSNSNSQQVLLALDLVFFESEYSTLNDAFDALDDGSVDYVACEAYAGGYLATAYTKISFGGTLDEPTSIGIALATDSGLVDDIEAAMDTLFSNGVLDIVKASWIGDLPELNSATTISGLMTADEADAAADATETSTE